MLDNGQLLDNEDDEEEYNALSINAIAGFQRPKMPLEPIGKRMLHYPLSTVHRSFLSFSHV